MMNGYYPGRVVSYEKGRRRARVHIDGLTDGALAPEAELLYSLGDKSRAGSDSTEVKLEAGDTVWLQFIGGDPRYPLIVGYRNPETGNGVDWRRWEHANMEWLVERVANLLAGGDVKIKSGTRITLEAPSVQVQCTTATINASGSTSINSPSTTVSGTLTVQGSLSAQGGASIGGGGATVTGQLAVAGSIKASGSISPNTP